MLKMIISKMEHFQQNRTCGALRNLSVRAIHPWKRCLLFEDLTTPCLLFWGHGNACSLFGVHGNACSLFWVHGFRQPWSTHVLHTRAELQRFAEAVTLKNDMFLFQGHIPIAYHRKRTCFNWEANPVLAGALKPVKKHVFDVKAFANPYQT